MKASCVCSWCCSFSSRDSGPWEIFQLIHRCLFFFFCSMAVHRFHLPFSSPMATNITPTVPLGQCFFGASFPSGFRRAIGSDSPRRQEILLKVGAVELGAMPLWMEDSHVCQLGDIQQVSFLCGEHATAYRMP